VIVPCHMYKVRFIFHRLAIWEQSLIQIMFGCVWHAGHR
jgi:hypothetical protein